ncbi:arylsulfatase A-like enzyme [Flavobacterium sp. 28A]|uniref:sulfatase family protein n=1 Tax=Flavobacterium sp. 28A TaxID=2735895 RepID=UPI001D6D9E8A|nr:arylsulfatase [Flavobacterium sp. 28A]NRT14965.1 arylsulfatase A-like enzyme [Flavobacterium sp. 28A]
MISKKNNMIRNSFTFLATIILFFDGYGQKKELVDLVNKKPNIIFIYADDLGYGDLGIYDAQGIKTPNIDKLAIGGIKFTDAYATSATCTPSRYGLLTGSYPWRNAKAKILPGTAPLLIDTLQMTIPKMLRANGYDTGIVGKWHLGLGTGNVDWNKHISPGPNEVGFDYSFIMAATQDRVPTVYIRNGNVVGLDPKDPIEVSYKTNFDGEPTALSNPEMLKMKWHHGHNQSIVNGIPRIGFMKGGASAKWVDEDMADTFLEEAKNYISSHKKAPFFLYYALQQPHVPRTPSPRFVGASGLGPRGDVIVEADWCVGQLMEELEAQGLLENTLIVLSSDNGPVLNDGYYDVAVEKLGNHKPAGLLRGGKYSLFDGGTRVPFITYWDGTIQAGVSDAVVCQVDLLASLAKLVGSNETNYGDSENLLNELVGNSKVGRKSLVLEANSKTLIRQGDWIMIPPYKGASKINTEVNIEMGADDDYQLYNTKEDISQKNNLAKKFPKKLKELRDSFEKIRGVDYGNVSELKLQ